MINTKTGTIEIENKSLKLSPKLKRNTFLGSDLFADVIEEENFGDFHNYSIEAQKLNGDKFMIKLFFNNQDLLNMLTLVKEQENQTRDWQSWSDAEELAKRQEHNQWLKQKIGPPPYKFSWGVIESAYEVQSGSSSIIIRYTAQ